MRDRIDNKLELASLELDQMEEKDISLVDASSASMQNFFRARGLYLLMAMAVFIFRRCYRGIALCQPL